MRAISIPGTSSWGSPRRSSCKVGLAQGSRLGVPGRALPRCCGLLSQRAVQALRDPHSPEACHTRDVTVPVWVQGSFLGPGWGTAATRSAVVDLEGSLTMACFKVRPSMRSRASISGISEVADTAAGGSTSLRAAACMARLESLNWHGAALTLRGEFPLSSLTRGLRP